MNDGAAGFRVLVVEDEPLIGMEIEYAVQQLGHDVVGPIAVLAEALELTATGDFECAILDINIRGGNSYPVADKLLECGVPFLLLSGYRTETFPERFHEQPQLRKPFTTEQLDQAIRNLCAEVQISVR